MEKNNKTLSEKIISICKENGYTLPAFFEQILYVMNIFSDANLEHDRFFKYFVGLAAIKHDEILTSKLFDTEVISRIEKQCGCTEGLLSNINAPYRSQEEGWMHTFANILETIATHLFDKEGTKNLAYQLMKTVCDGSHAKSMVTNTIIAELESAVADIKDGEEVCDGTVGLGYSLGVCADNKKCQLTINDIDDRNVRDAALYLNLIGDYELEARVGDFTIRKSEKKFDKVVMNIPFGTKVKELNGHQVDILIKYMNTDYCKDGDVLFTAAGLDALKDKGRLVLVVPQSFLFKQGLNAVCRERLRSLNLLRAVIDLPAGLDNTRVKTSMLVFEKGNDDVIYVDASKLINRGRRSEASITLENKRLLTDIINEKKEVEGISHKVSIGEIKEIGDWSYSRYFMEETEVVYRSIEDINKDINECMEQISAIDNKIGKMQLFN